MMQMKAYVHAVVSMPIIEFKIYENELNQLTLTDLETITGGDSLGRKMYAPEACK